MSLFSCLPWFAKKTAPVVHADDVPPSGPLDDPNARVHRESIATRLSACLKLACRHPDAATRKELLALLAHARERFTQPPPDYDASRRIEVEEDRAYQLQREIASVLEQLAAQLTDDEIPLNARLDALEVIGLVLGGWRTTQPIVAALEEKRKRMPAPDRHQAIRQAVANGDAAGLSASLDALHRRRPRPDPRQLLQQTLRNRDGGPPITLLSHAVAHGHADVARRLVQELACLRRARMIDARGQVDHLKHTLRPAVLHRAASVEHIPASVAVCVDALCLGQRLQPALRRAMPSVMTALIKESGGQDGFAALLAQMGRTRQGRAVAAQALEDLTRGRVLVPLCRAYAPMEDLRAYLRGLLAAAKTGAVSGKALGQMLLAPGPTGRPAIADARGQLRACVRQVLGAHDIQQLIGAHDRQLLHAAIGPN